VLLSALPIVRRTRFCRRCSFNRRTSAAYYMSGKLLLASPAQSFLVPSILTDGLTAKFLMALASTVIVGSDPHGTHDHIFLSDGSGSLQTNSLSEHTPRWDRRIYPRSGPPRLSCLQKLPAVARVVTTTPPTSPRLTHACLSQGIHVSRGVS
jgi:hypothetical protein